MVSSNSVGPMDEAVIEAIHRLYSGDRSRAFPKVDIVRQLQNVLISPHAERLEEDRDTGRIEGALNALPDREYTEQQLLEQLGMPDSRQS